MAKYKVVAVIYGSDSSEWEVSCRSGEFTASCVDGSVYDVYEIFARFGRWELAAMRRKNAMRVPFPEGARPEVDKSDFSVKVLGEKIKFDFAYIMQHGFPGETGQMQGYLEMLGVPYSGCSAYVSAVSFDKFSCKCYLRGLEGIKLANFDFIRRDAEPVEAFSERILGKLRLPLFVKPTGGGSSFGITKVKSAEALPEAIRYAFSEGDTVIVEEGIVGRELTCAVYFDGKSVQALPVIEIVTENEYFDYDAKYNGHSQEISPAPIPDEMAKQVQDASRKIYFRLGCKGVVRMDYICAEDGLYFLEVNTIPGMTQASLVPKMVRTAGMDMSSFLSTLIENS